MHRLLQKAKLFLCLLCLLSLANCATRGAVLTSDQRQLIIPKGQTFQAVWDGKVQDFKAEEDLVIVYKGYLLKLQQEAANNVMYPK